MTSRVARVLPDVRGIDKEFDYSVPDDLAPRLGLGSIVRVSLHGRRVRGWVTALPEHAAPGVALRPIVKLSGLGPAADVIELARWAAWRWATTPSFFLAMASPPVNVTGLPPLRTPAAVPVALDPLGDAAVAAGRAVVRLPPAADPFGIVLAACRRGHALVLAPSVAAARTMAGRLRRAGLGVALHPRDWAIGATGATVVGTRAAAWAPVAGLAAVVVIDEHDEALQQEGAPTWSGRDVAIERARRAAVPCVLTSPVPSLEAQMWGSLLTVSRNEEREGWPVVEVVDRGRDDPASRSLVTQALFRQLRRGVRVVCVLNRPGQARLLACAACTTLARCEHCGAAVEEPEIGRLRCRRCGAERPAVCASCGASRFKRLRPGVARLREELEAAAGEPVVEVTGTTEEIDGRARVLVGTEAVLHRVDRADVVAFLDFDEELLAPRFRAGEQAIALLARAARLVGGREGGGRLLVQTRVPHHDVLDAVLRADPSRWSRAERDKRQRFHQPPFAALATVRGTAAEAYVAAVGGELGIDVGGSAGDGFLVRAADHRLLADAFAAHAKPSGVRVAVDPRRV